MSTSRSRRQEFVRSLVDQIIAFSGARSAERVLILGSEQIDFLIELVNRGFKDATCVAAEGGSLAAETPVDLVLAPAVHSESELSAALAKMRRALGPDGTLVIGTSDLSQPWEQRLKETLMAKGFAFFRSMRSLEGSDLLCCRKLPFSEAQAAAA
jgi:hypothetical protein